MVSAIRAHPNSLQLWLLRLDRFRLSSSSKRGAKAGLADMDALFREALKNVPAKVSLLVPRYETMCFPIMVVKKIMPSVLNM